MASKLGIDANRPIVVDPPFQGALSPTVANPDIIGITGAGWVRINFVLGPWQSPDDVTNFQGRTWQDTYRTIINQYRQRGMRIYGLIGHEATHEVPGDFFRLPHALTPVGESNKANAWITMYAANFGRIVQMFQNEVDVFESFNEPDDWHHADRAWVHPSWFAVLLQAVHDKVRGELGIRGPRLVTGPLQGLSINNNAPVIYMSDTYTAGRQFFRWGQGAPFPFDGIGYHIYITQGLNPDSLAHDRETRRVYREFVDGMVQVIRRFEGAGSTRQLYVSEIGWPSDGDNAEAERFQAQNVQLGMSLVDNDPAIAVGIWFATQDFDLRYGLYRRGPLAPGQGKPSLDAFREIVRNARPSPIDPDRDPNGGRAVIQPFTHQHLINAVYFAAGQEGLNGWTLLARAGLTYLVEDRNAIYTGAPINLLPNLSEAQKAAIKSQLPGAADRGLTEAVAEPVRGWAIRYRNQDLVNAFDFAAADRGQSGQEWLARAGLSYIRDTPAATYTGPGLTDLPGLTAEDRALVGSKLPTRPATPELNGKSVVILDVDDSEKGDLNRIVARVQEAGISNVILRIADGARPENIDRRRGDLCAPLTIALQGLHCEVWGWQTIYGQHGADMEAQAVAVIHRVRQLGLDGLVIHAGNDFEGQAKAATRYMETLRAVAPELPVALSAFRYSRGHRSFPWEEFLAHCDLHLPQVFWQRRTPRAVLGRSVDEHRQHRFARPVIPIGAAHNQESIVPTTAETLHAFLTTARDLGLPGAIVWRWETLNNAEWEIIQNA